MVDRADSARQTGPAVEAMYQFMLWLVPTVEKFPRSRKFLIGDRIQGTALSVLESLIDATYTRGRDRLLAHPCHPERSEGSFARAAPRACPEDPRPRTKQRTSAPVRPAPAATGGRRPAPRAARSPA